MRILNKIATFSELVDRNRKTAGLIKRADTNIVDFVKNLPDIRPTITNATSTITNRLAPWDVPYHTTVNTISNAANYIRKLTDKITDTAAGSVSTNIPPSGQVTSNLPEGAQKTIADAIVNHKEIANTVSNRQEQVTDTLTNLTPDAFKQIHRLQEELNTALHPTTEILNKVRRNTGYNDLMSGYDKLKTYNDLPWWKKMTGLHDSRPYLNDAEYSQAARVAGDPVMGEVINKTIRNPMQALNVSEDVAKTPNVATKVLAQAAKRVVYPILSSTPAQTWMTANAPILKSITPKLLGEAASVPAITGMVGNVGAEMGQLAGKTSVNGFSEIPKYFNSEMERQNPAPGLGGYLLAAENNIHKPVASLINYARPSNATFSLINDAKQFLTPDAFRIHSPAIPLPPKDYRLPINLGPIGSGMRRGTTSVSSTNPFEKLSADDTPELPLLPHQQRVVDRIQRPRTKGLVVAHGTGSGKSLTSIGALKALNMPTNIVVPAALQGNYRKELDKWLGGVPEDVNILSQQRLANPQFNAKLLPNSLDIVDEAQHAREPGSKLVAALQQSRAKKRLLLTATPTFNHPKDISTLVNLAAGKPVLPTTKPEFEDRYINKIKVYPNVFQRLMGVKPGIKPELKNKRELSRILHTYVDYYGGKQEHYPTSKEEEIKVPMGQGQTDIYRTIMGRAPAWLKWKVRAGLPPNKSELAAMQAFLTGARQVSNTSQGFVRDPRRVESAKIQSAFNYFNKQLQSNPSYKGVVYSNYLNSGLSPYKQLLKKYNVPYGEFSGDIGSKERNDLVKQYNANKLRALLISSAGSEGLDLKGTRLVQILEPHFNEEKEKQITGRAIRYKSHEGLPPDQQNVLIQRYLAQPKAGLFDKLLGRDTVRGTDEYIRNMALQKTLLTNEITKLLQQ